MYATDGQQWPSQGTINVVGGDVKSVHEDTMPDILWVSSLHPIWLSRSEYFFMPAVETGKAISAILRPRCIQRKREAGSGERVYLFLDELVVECRLLET